MRKKHASAYRITIQMDCDVHDLHIRRMVSIIEKDSSDRVLNFVVDDMQKLLQQGCSEADVLQQLKEVAK